MGLPAEAVEEVLGLAHVYQKIWLPVTSISREQRAEFAARLLPALETIRELAAEQNADIWALTLAESVKRDWVRDAEHHVISLADAFSPSARDVYARLNESRRILSEEAELLVAMVSESHRALVKTRKQFDQRSRYSLAGLVARALRRHDVDVPKPRPERKTTYTLVLQAIFCDILKDVNKNSNRNGLFTVALEGYKRYITDSWPETPFEK